MPKYLPEIGWKQFSRVQDNDGKGSANGELGSHGQGGQERREVSPGG